ncbi:hypothetical protein BSR29_00535 [Boudabousia liubingyangii]|uniref:DUF5672 domain-containing protein n=1 Tax=Boudabousia liubingyangii TaxID=1921764 RepID=A0A1Q5PPK5_9ACTO|nr:hypothetical protein [Boudabousia liubingyangii]OKL49484.1 hypothetical protein BSR29_00535 [Boudabousia liubingyangii]
MKTLIAVRCQALDDDAYRIAHDLKDSIPGDVQIAYVRDERNVNFDPISEWGGGVVVPITKDYLTDLGLFWRRENIGWICGDYVYYAVLHLEWDHLWVVEPDVFLAGDVRKLFGEVSEMDYDFVGTRIWERNDSWVWYDKIHRVWPEATVWSAFFPLTRVTREVATACYAARLKISEMLEADETLFVPNDEAVVGTVVNNFGFTKLNLMDKYKEEFRYWGFRPSYCYTNFSASTSPIVVHPAYAEEKFIERVAADVDRSIADGLLKRSLKHATPEQLKQMMSKLS